MTVKANMVAFSVFLLADLCTLTSGKLGKFMRFNEYQSFLIFAVFLASGISFIPGKPSQIFVRISVAIVGIVACLLITGGILFAVGFSAGFGARSFGQDGLRMLGAALIAFYFAVCSITCFPIVPSRYFRRAGVGLHFIFLPIVVGLWALSPSEINIPFSFRLGSYATELSLGLAYAMLWFRMATFRIESFGDAT